jgi:hypothetical protein
LQEEPGDKGKEVAEGIFKHSSIGFPGIACAFCSSEFGFGAFEDGNGINCSCFFRTCTSPPHATVLHQAFPCEPGLHDHMSGY